jgi:hypothetical protein
MRIHSPRGVVTWAVAERCAEGSGRITLTEPRSNLFTFSDGIRRWEIVALEAPGRCVPETEGVE